MLPNGTDAGHPEHGLEIACRKIMHEEHRQAAEQHELAAHAHRTAVEHNETGDLISAAWHAQRALEFSEHAYQLAKEAQSKSGQIVSI